MREIEDKDFVGKSIKSIDNVSNTLKINFTDGSEIELSLDFNQSNLDINNPDFSILIRKEIKDTNVLIDLLQKKCAKLMNKETEEDIKQLRSERMRIISEACRLLVK